MLRVQTQTTATQELQRLPTPLVWAEALGRACGIEALYLKLDGDTPSGTHKDAMARLAVQAAAARGVPGIALATCGSSAAALAWLCAPRRIPYRIFAARGTRPPAGAERDFDATYASYEDAVVACDRWTQQSGFLNATAGRDMAEAYLSAYAPAAQEIVTELGEAPGEVVCPAGNGTTFASLYRGFVAATATVPRLFAVTIPQNGFGAPCPSPARIDPVTEPLRSSRPLDRAAALEAADRSGGGIVVVNRGDLIAARGALYSLEGISCHPASAAPIAALARLRDSGCLRGDERVVAFLTTGRRKGG